MILVRFQHIDGRNLQRKAQTEEDAVAFLRDLGSSIKGGTLYRDKKPFKSFAWTRNGLIQTNP